MRLCVPSEILPNPWAKKMVYIFRQRYSLKGYIGQMPLCPKCGKSISESKIRRHVRRCGTSHKKLTYELPGKF